MKKILAILIVASFYNCKGKDEIVVSHKLKYGEGYHIGDFPRFKDTLSKEGYYYTNDTIYKEGTPVALVEKTEYYVDHYLLYITSLSKGEKGLYMEFGPND